MAAKGFKVTDAERKSKVGIAVRSLADLQKKTVDKFKLKQPSREIKFQTTDGTAVDSEEYFQTLPAQTVLIWLGDGQRADTDAEILYRTIREVNDEYLSAGEKVQEFFSEKMKTKVFKLAEVLKGIDGAEAKAKLSTKAEHPEWFQGLETRAQTKEEYLFKRAQDRIRTYFYKTREELQKTSPTSPTKSRKALTSLLSELQSRLKLSKHQGHLFDRSQDGCLCDQLGNFGCQGRWDKERCLYAPPHNINPYKSREERIVFQTWNLDHGRERSRFIVPALKTALLKQPQSLDYKAIFADLFTVQNLKLCHIVCHDKAKHDTEIRQGQYLLK